MILQGFRWIKILVVSVLIFHALLSLAQEEELYWGVQVGLTQDVLVDKVPLDGLFMGSRFMSLGGFVGWRKHSSVSVSGIQLEVSTDRSSASGYLPGASVVQTHGEDGAQIKYPSWEVVANSEISILGKFGKRANFLFLKGQLFYGIGGITRIGKKYQLHESYSYRLNQRSITLGGGLELELASNFALQFESRLSSELDHSWKDTDGVLEIYGTPTLEPLTARISAAFVKSF